MSEGEMFACESGTIDCAITNCGAPFLMLSTDHITNAYRRNDEER